jgi:hypothetical protein
MWTAANTSECCFLPQKAHPVEVNTVARRFQRRVAMADKAATLETSRYRSADNKTGMLENAAPLNTITMTVAASASSFWSFGIRGHLGDSLR